MRNLNVIQAVAFALLMSLLGTAFAADKPATQADLNELQKQVNTIDKELAVLKETKAGLEKRQTEITAGQANSLAAIANQTTTVGNYITNTSIAITLLLFIGGLATYIGITKKVEVKAEKAAKKWIDENSVTLEKQIAELQAQAAKSSDDIKELSKRFKSDTDAATAQIADQVKAVRTVSAQVLDSRKPGRDGDSVGTTNQEAIKIVREASDTLKAKPEVSFSADDFYARGLADYTNQNYQSALLAFQKAIEKRDPSAPAQQQVDYLFAKAVTLGQLGESEQAIAGYDDIDQRFGKDAAPGVREQVAKGLVNKGITLSHLDMPEQAIAVYDDIDQRFGRDAAPGVRESVAAGLFNKGGRLSLLGKSEEAIALYNEIDQRFGEDTAPGVREQVASALNAKSFNQIIQAKKHWADKPHRSYLLASAETALLRALSICAQGDRAMVLGNIGYAKFLLGKEEEAEASTKECLRLSGQEIFEAQLADAKVHRVEPQDRDYEKMLTNVWETVDALNSALKNTCGDLKIGANGF